MIKFQNIKRYTIIALIFIGFIYAGFIKPPNDFPTGVIINIEEGSTINQTANLLEKEKAIHSSIVFSVLARLFGGEAGVLSGPYAFEKKLTVLSVWSRVSRGETGEPLIRVTLPEGSTIREMAEILSEQIPGFDSALFRELAREKEGYLFPETYVVAPGMKPETFISLMEETFAERVKEIEEEVEAFGVPLSDVVIMASILEKEARRFKTKQRVAGILWKRIEIGMPLQVDAVFGFIFDRDTFNPTFDDLEVDSPYNTYTNLGLPPGPISNPGIGSMRAAIRPIETPYLYYLTGADGTMHYARTFEAHVENRRFLR